MFLSASTVSRLKQVWGEQYRLGCEERLDADRWVYVWADGIYSGLRAEQTKLFYPKAFKYFGLVPQSI